MLLEGVVKVIQRDRLLDNVKVTGNYLLTGLKDAEVCGCFQSRAGG